MSVAITEHLRRFRKIWRQITSTVAVPWMSERWASLHVDESKHYAFGPNVTFLGGILALTLHCKIWYYIIYVLQVILIWI